MITIQVSTFTLATLLDGKFSLCAVEAIAEYLNEIELETPLAVGDIYLMFSEVTTEEAQEDEGSIIAYLPNNKALVRND